MSISMAETFLRNAKRQHSQTDINESLIRAIGDLIRELKALESDVHRVRNKVRRQFE